MTSQPASGLARHHKILMGMVAAVYVWTGLVLLHNHMSYSCFDGDEGSHATLSYQSSKGMPLYGHRNDPKTWDLFAYTPLSYQLLGMAMRLGGTDIRVLRGANVLLALIVMVLIGLITHRLSKNLFLSILAGALMIAIPSPAWFIQHGPNTFVVLFALLGLWLLLRDPGLSWFTVTATVVSLFASFWSKQTGLAFLVAAIVYILLVDRRKGLMAAVIATGLMIVAVGYYSKYPGFLYNVFVLQKEHPMLWPILVNPVLFPENFGRFGVLFAVILCGVWNEEWTLKNLARPEFLFLGAAAVVGLVGRLKYGSGPTQAIMFNGLTFACGFYFLNKMMADGKIDGRLVTVLICMQMLALTEDIRPLLYNDNDQVRFDEIQNLVATPGKEVYYSDNPYMAVLAGKTYYAPPGRDCYVDKHIDRSRYPQEIRDFFSKDPFDWVIIDIPTEDNSWFLYERLNASYQPIREFPALPNPTTRLRMRKIILARKDLLPPQQQPSPM